MPQNSKTALVISGGGAKGAFAVGVIKNIFDRFNNTGWFKIVGGSSTGGLITPLAALMDSNSPYRDEAKDALVHMYTHVTTRDILEHQGIMELLFRHDCLNESDPLNDLLHEIFKPEWFNWLNNHPDAPQCYVVYTNYRTGEKVHADPKAMNREQFLQAMLASASVPVLMEATHIDGDVCYDGGVRDLLPFGRAIELGAERILPIFLDPDKFPISTNRFKRLDKILLRTLSILVDETGRNDFQLANLINIGIRAKADLLHEFAGDAGALQKIQAVFNKAEYGSLFDKKVIELTDRLRPNNRLTENSLEFNPASMQQWVTLGEQKAEEVITTDPFA